MVQPVTRTPAYDGLVNEKKCNVCGQVKPLSAFNRMAASPDGHQYTCRECVSRKHKERKGEHAVEQREYRAEVRRELLWYRENYPQEGKPWNE